MIIEPLSFYLLTNCIHLVLYSPAILDRQCVDSFVAVGVLSMRIQELSIQSQEQNQDIANKILLAIKDLRFGSVEIVIHDSKVVQIERKEKIRIDQNSLRPT